MTGKRLTCLLLSLSLTASPASAGMVVTDPNSYTYYVEQLKKMEEQVTQYAKQIETMNGVLTEAQKIERNLTGHYSRAMALVNRVKRLSDTMNSQPTGIIGEAKKWGNVGRQIGGVLGGAANEGRQVVKDVNDIAGTELYEDTKKILDQVFTDPRDINNPQELYRSMDRRNQIKQGALKEVVAKAEQTLGGIKERIKTVQELGETVDKTENQKDAQDLTNRILLEVLATLTDLLAVAAQANQAQALLSYTGVNDSIMESRKQELESIGSSTSKLRDALQNNSQSSQFRLFGGQ